MKTLTMTMALVLATACGCGAKVNVTDVISGKVMSEMQAKYVQETCYRNLKLDKVLLINSEGNKYTGFAFGKIGEHEVKFDIDCVSDGTNVKWEARPAEGCDFTFLAKEGASNLCDDAKTVASNLCDSAKGVWESGKTAATEGLQSAGEKLEEIVDGMKSAVGGALEKAGEAVKSAGGSASPAPASAPEPAPEAK